MLVLLPLQMLSGGMAPRESMPEFVQVVMLGAPTTHFVDHHQKVQNLRPARVGCLGAVS